MPTINLTQTEKVSFLELLEDFCDILANNGCNDYYMANTPENQKFVENAMLWNSNQFLDEWDKEKLAKWKEVDVSGNPVFKRIETQDYLILTYLKHKIDESK